MVESEPYHTFMINMYGQEFSASSHSTSKTLINQSPNGEPLIQPTRHLFNNPVHPTTQSLYFLFPNHPVTPYRCHVAWNKLLTLLLQNSHHISRASGSATLDLLLRHDTFHRGDACRIHTSSGWDNKVIYSSGDIM